MSRYVLGIDGGGTRTRAVILNEFGELIGTSLGGPSNYDDIGPDQTRNNLQETIKTAWEQAEVSQQPFDAAFFGMAGVTSNEDRRIIREIACGLDIAPNEVIGVHHDIRIALAGALAGRSGLVLITGTGSACYGINEKGDDWRSGGWGQMLADEGSGYWLGRKAMQAAVQAADGRGAKTRLLDDVMKLLRLDHINDIMHRVYHIGLSRAETAGLAQLVMDAVRDGDVVAQSILTRGIDELALTVEAAARKLHMLDTPEISMVGGLQNVVDIFVEPLQDAIRKRLPGCRIIQPEYEPVIGACLLALQNLDIDVHDMRETLRLSQAQVKANFAGN